MRTDAAFVSSLKACAAKKDLLTGFQLHHEIVLARGLLRNPYLASSLINMYAKCGAISRAQQIHDEFDARNVVTWNALIFGYAGNGQGLEPLDCYGRMQNEGVFPNHVTFLCVLKACGSIGAIDKGKQIHCEAGSSVKDLADEHVVMIGSTLVDMYVKCGMVATAQKVHNDLCARNVVTWSALIAGYVQQGQAHEALNAYEKMRSEGISPDAVTFTCVLKACACLGAIDKGKTIHDEITSTGLLRKDIMLGTTLLNLYAKCGMLEKAEKVLRELPDRDIVTWNALISGYAQHGRGKEALKCLKSMVEEGVAPDGLTFLSVLTACSHSGLLEEAQLCFTNMRQRHDIRPNSEHYTCMVAVYGCIGHFDDAVSMLKAMPSLCGHSPVWLALLDACRKWGNVKLGALAFNQAIQVDDSSAAYALMASIYADAGMMKDADKVEAMRLESLNLQEG